MFLLPPLLRLQTFWLLFFSCILFAFSFCRRLVDCWINFMWNASTWVSPLTQIVFDFSIFRTLFTKKNRLMMNTKCTRVIYTQLAYITMDRDAIMENLRSQPHIRHKTKWMRARTMQTCDNRKRWKICTSRYDMGWCGMALEDKHQIVCTARRRQMMTFKLSQNRQNSAD